METGSKKMKFLFFLCLALISPVVVVQAQQAPINCKGQLSEEQLIGLLKARVDDVRVQAIVRLCGVGFSLTSEAERRLRTAGASDAVIAVARARAAKPPEKPPSKSDDAAREQKLWEGAKDGKSAERLEDYLRQFPKGQHASEARDKLSKLTKMEELRGKIRQAKEGGQWQEAEARLQELGALLPEDEEMRSWKSWVTEERARKSDDAAREEKLWESAKDGRSAERLEDYLRQFPNGQHSSEAWDKRSNLKEAEELRGKIRQAKEGGQWREAEARLQELGALLPEDEQMRTWKSWVSGERARWDSMTLVEAREEIASLEKKVEEVRKTEEAARDVELKPLDEKYKIEREQIGQVAPQGMFETTAQYKARLARVQASQDDLESKHKAEREGIERRYAAEMERQSQGDLRRMEALKARTYVEEGAKIEFVSYGADDSRLGARVDGQEYWFHIEPKDAEELVRRLSTARVEQYLDAERAQERVLYDASTGQRFAGALRSDILALTWVDPKTKMMWARKDNGSDVNWNEAVSYCQQLRVGGFTTWRLPEIGELEGILDASLREKGGIRLSSYWVWSATSAGRSAAWSFFFVDGSRASYSLDGHDYGRALCVRWSGE
jgi:hypothetical protein